MTTERELRSALHDTDAQVEGSWSDVTRRAAQITARRSRTRVLAGGVAVVTVIAVLAAFLLPSGGSDRDDSVVTTRPAAGELLARVEENGVAKLVVLSAADGHVVREISRDPSLAGFSSVAAPATGEAAILTTSVPDPPTATCSSDIQRAPVVSRINLTTGALETLFTASSAPVVSLDGTWLAYITDFQTCAVPRSPTDPVNTLAISRLPNVSELRSFGSDAQRARQPLAWTPDGSRLLVRLAPGKGGGPALVVTDEYPVPDDLPEMRPLPGDFESATYLPDGRLVMAYRVGPQYGEAVHHVVVVDDTGRVVEKLFSVTSEGSLGSGGGAGISADAHGRIVLLFEDGPARPRSGGVVQIWSPRHAEPRTVLGPGTPAFDVKSVAWMPEAVPGPSSDPGDGAVNR